MSKRLTEKKCPICLVVKQRLDFYAGVNGKIAAYCIPCTKAKSQEWLAKKRQDDPEYLKNRERMRAINDPDRAKRRYRNNIEHYRMKNSEYYYKHREKKQAAGREGRKKWAANNPEHHKALKKNSKAMRRLRIGSSIVSAKDIMAIKAKQFEKCAICKIFVGDKYHLDHIMPLALGGKHDVNNLQVLCKCCNLQKGARHPVEFMQSRGFLL